MRSCFIRWVTFIVLIAVDGHLFAANAIWVGPAAGSWNTAANWSTGVVPSSTSAVLIDQNPNQNTSVELSTGASVGSITIDFGDTLTVPTSANINVISFGPIHVDGKLNFNGALLTTSTVLDIGPTGELKLTNANSQIGANIVIEAGGLAHGGSPSFGATVNDGDIRADIPQIPLNIKLIALGEMQNHGRLLATDGGNLKIGNANNAKIIGGRIEAWPKSKVTLGTGIIDGATIAVMDDNDPTTAAPVFEYAGANLRNVTFSGNFTIPTAGGLGWAGTMVNTGEIAITRTGVQTDLNVGRIGISPDTVLTGGGSIRLDSPTVGNVAFFGALSSSSTSSLLNADNLIHGLGHLVFDGTVAVTNHAVIDADVSNPQTDLVLNGRPEVTHVNAGIMRASNGGHLRFGNFVTSTGSLALVKNFDDTGLGQIIARESSVVEVSQTTIQGGIVKCEGTTAATQGKFIFDGLASLKDVTIQGTLRTLDGSIPLAGRINNEGVIASQIAPAGNVQLAGSGEVLASNTWINFNTTSGSFTNLSNLIHGTGTMSRSTSAPITFINRGTVRAEGGTLASGLTTNFSLTNSGRMEAATGSTLNFTGVDIANYEGTSGGTIFAANGGNVQVTTVHRGTLATEGTGAVNVAEGGTLDQVHNTGNLNINFAHISGEFVNDGTMKGSLTFNTSPASYLRLLGTGQWEATNLVSPPGTIGLLLVNSPQHTIIGKGSLGSQTKNLYLQNEGSIVATNMGIVGAQFENSGLVQVPALGSLFVNMPTGSLENDGIMLFDGDSTMTVGTFNNHSGGWMNINSKLTLDQTPKLSNLEGGLLTGSGTLRRFSPNDSTILTNDGRIAPGSGIATLFVSGGFEQHASGRLQMEAASGMTLKSDLLQITGKATLAGNLDVTLTSGGLLKPGDAFTLLTATGAIVGGFDHLSLPTLNPGLYWSTTYIGGAVQIHVTDIVPGDFNHDSVVDSGDYVVYRSALTTGDLSADANGNNAIDPGDLEVWRQHLGDQTSYVEPHAVPEPAAGALLFVAAAAISARRRARRQ